MPMTVCAAPGCGALVRKGRCPAHALQRNRERGSSTERGYDSDWRKVREVKLSMEPLCHDCMDRGRVTPANEVHHIEKFRNRPELRLKLENLMSLCGPCHDARGARGE